MCVCVLLCGALFLTTPRTPRPLLPHTKWLTLSRLEGTMLPCQLNCCRELDLL